MLTHRLRTIRTAATIITLLAVTGYQGAAAQGQPPPAPQNTMSHLIAGTNQEPQVRISWDAPAQGTVTSHTVSRNDGQNFEVPGGATTYGDRAIVPGTAYSIPHKGKTLAQSLSWPHAPVSLNARAFPDRMVPARQGAIRPPPAGIPFLLMTKPVGTNS